MKIIMNTNSRTPTNILVGMMKETLFSHYVFLEKQKASERNARKEKFSHVTDESKSGNMFGAGMMENKVHVSCWVAIMEYITSACNNLVNMNYNKTQLST
jgi:uncharacterized protein YycO